MPSQLPRDPSRLDFSGVMFHELGHALGILSGVQDDLEDSPTPRFGERLNQWSEHLRDDNGNPARPGQAIMCSQCDHSYSADAFDVRKDQGYFSGRHVDEVLAGAMPGLPVRMLSAGQLDEDYMSHIELRNSLMSHQDYRNYTSFVEAELAAMQDMGLQLDRRNFFGFSVYGDGLTLDNRNPYAARNAAGTAYVPGKYNTATLGLGLHVYGERNHVTQSADLLSAGNYVQESTGRLVLETNARGGRDTLTVNGLASVAGELHMALQPDWYADGWTVRSSELFRPAGQEGDFDVLVASIASPTLLVDTRDDAGSPRGYAWSVMRGSDAYSQFARSGNGAALGRALGRASSEQQLPLRDLYRSLDFSRMDGADVTTALEQLGPGAYGALTADSIQRDHRVGALLGTRGLFTALPATRPSGWQAFVQPYGYHATQDRREGLASHRTSETGMLVGLERSTREDWTYGLNLSISELDSTSRSPHNGKGSSTAFQLGVHTRYQPAQDPRLHFAAYARAGAEQGKMKRGVGFSDYQASHDSDWSGASFNAGLATAYAWPLNKAVSVGPVLGLDYVHAYRPGVDESGPAASKLNLSSLKADSLQSSLGLMARADWQLKNAQRLQGYMAVTWEHEWLSRYATQQARFATSPGIAFSQRIAVGAPDAMGLRAGMDFAPQPNVAVRASVATRLFSPGQQDVGADVSVSWAF